MANYGNRLARIDVLIGGADQARKQVEDMRKEWAKLGKEVQAAQKKMEATVDTVEYDKNKAVYTEAVKQQKQLQKSIQETERNINTVEKYLADVSGQTLRNLNNARKGLNQMLLGINPKNFETLRTVRDYIKQVNDEIQRRKGTLIEFSDIMGNIGTVSDKSLSMAKQRLQELVASTEQNTAEIQKYRDQLKKVEDEEQRRISSKAGRIMGNLGGSTVSEIQEAIKVTTQLRDAQKLGSQEWEIYNDEIQRAQKYLSDFNELGKQLAMSDRMTDLAKASTASLTELKKYWQEQVNGAQRGSQELAEYEKQLKLVTQEEERRISKSAVKVFSNLSGSSVSEIEDAIKATTQLRNAQELGSRQWEIYNRYIENARKYLSDFEETSKNIAIAKRMQNLGDASTASLVELKKFWQEQIDGAELSSQKLDQYKQSLEAITKEEQKRLSQRAQSTLGSIQGGTFNATIGETKEAIKLLEQYKQQLKVSDTQGIQQVDDAIKSLNESIKKASDHTASLQDSLDLAEKVGKGTFDGTIEDLEKLKKTLEEYQKKLKLTDADGLEKVQKALQDIDKKQKELTKSTVKLDDVMLNLHTKPLEDLQKAAAMLQEELSTAERGTREYIETSRKLRMVNSQINEVKRSWQEHDNQIIATIKRLTSYVLVYAGFNEVWGRIKQLTQANLELSDSLADIQKTTGLSAESVAELSREIDSIDTRTAQQELHDLAYEAGKLGISAKEDVLAFVKAGNQLLVALGEELGGAEAVRQLMKVNAILGETQKLGIEKALLATGSAINEISQTSRASAGPIVDIVTRIGAIGNAAGLSMSDLIALGGALDALGQNAEVSGTALNTFISTLTSETTEVAQAVGLSDEYLRNLISQGKTIEAIIAVFEKMNAMGSLDILAPLMKDLGSDGERIKQVLVTLSSGVEELKAQVFTSTRAFKEATSVTEEYSIKNESAMAIVQRMGNAIKENIVNSGLVEWITDVLRWIASIPNKFERGEKGIRLLAVAIEVLVGVLIATSKAAQTASFNMLLFFDRVKKGAVSINVFSTALKGLWKAMKMNPIGWLTLGVTALASAWTYFTEKVSEAGKALAEFESTIQKERFELDNLRFAIDKANDKTGERAALIKQLNDKYGAYLGFMVTENNYAEKQEYIYRLINARLRETLALKMRDKMMDNITERYSDVIQGLQSDIINELNEMKRVGETNAGAAMSAIMDGINKAAEEGLTTNDALKSFFEKFGYSGEDSYIGSRLWTAANELLKVQKAIRQETEQTEKYLESASRAAKKEADVLMLMDLRKSNEGILSSKDGRELNTYLQQANTYVQRLRDSIDELNAKRDKGEKLSKDEEANLKEKNKQLGVYQHNIEQVQNRIKALGMESVWGQGLSLETAGVDKLVATYKKLEAMMKSINEDKDYAATFAARGFKSAKEEYDALKKMEDDVARVLKDKWGRDTSGNWLKERKGGSRGEDKKMREEIDSAMSALEAYFLRRQQAIRQAYLDEQITTEEMNRQIDQTEEEHLLARVELRKRLLGKESTFNKDLYDMSDKDLDKLAGFLQKLGDRETDGMQKKLEEDLLAMMNNIIKYRQEIEKELRKYNPFESLVYQYEQSLDKLRLLSTDMEKIFRASLGLDSDVGTEAIKERVNALVELSEDAYSINETQLREYLSNIDAVWAESMSPEQMSLMLKKLRDFYQDSKAAAEKYAKDIRQMVEIQWQTGGNEKMWEDMIKSSNQYADMMRTAGGLGLTSSQSSILGTSAVDDAELETLRIKLEAAQKYYEQFYARKEELIQQAIASGATEQQAEESYRMAEKEALDALTEAREQQAEKELEITREKLESLKGYTDAVVDFSYQMGEAAFGEVEDRKAAAKMLIQTAMKLSKDLIMQKVQELVMKKALNAQEVAQEAATSGAVTAIHGTQAVTDLTVQGAKTAGDISAGIASGSAKTVGQLGWWGIPLIAVISAALSALMGIAMSKMNKAKEEVASATGVSSSKSRVVAGMLTYAKGDYPVLGNDGQIYNARYQKELKTGVYGGGAHFGIFSEKKPEMIVDGDTTQKLILNYPHIYDSILTIARHGQLKQAAMPTFATGNYPSAPSTVSGVPTQTAVQDMMTKEQMQQTLTELTAAVASLTDRLNQPISATMDPYQANKTLKKTDKFMNKRGLV